MTTHGDGSSGWLNATGTDRRDEATHAAKEAPKRDGCSAPLNFRGPGGCGQRARPLRTVRSDRFPFDLIDLLPTSGLGAPWPDEARPPAATGTRAMGPLDS